MTTLPKNMSRKQMIIEQLEKLLKYHRLQSHGDSEFARTVTECFTRLISELELLHENSFEAQDMHAQALISHSQNQYRMY